MDRNQQAAGYLELLQNLQAGADIAFRTQLQEIRFDHSRESLERIDAMLFSLRTSMTMDYTTFVGKQPAVNFIAALNFYIGTTIARLGNFALKWIAHEQARAFMPELPARLETELGCIVADGIYFPANVVTEILFDPNQVRTCSSFADGIIERWTAEGRGLPEPLPKPAGDPPLLATLSPVWKDALDGAGSLAAWGVSEVAGGALAKPVAMLPGAKGQRVLVDFSTFGHSNMHDAIEDGLRRLERNPEGAAWQALYYDGFVNLPTGRRDALVVEVRVYEAVPKSLLGGLFKGKGAAARTSLSLTMAIPYRPANSNERFANFAPRMVDCSYEGAELPAMLDTFYRGIYSSGHFQWDRQYAEG
jgi:hypothetical protein